MKNNNAEILLKELELDPTAFFNNGRSYNLLQEYFSGLSLDTLIPLLESDNGDVQKTGIWIVSELAKKACSLLKHVVPLVKSRNSYIKYHALECILLCGIENQVNEFVHLIDCLDDKEAFIRIRTMYLLSNAEKAQLERGPQLVADYNINDYETHQIGLKRLAEAENIEDIQIVEMLNSSRSLIQQYGAMIVKRNYKKKSTIIKDALFSKNSDVSEFAKLVIDIEG